MKNYVYFLILIFILASCAVKKEMVKPEGETAVTPDYEYYWVIKPQINIRAANTVNSAGIANLVDGDSLRVMDNKNGWYEVLLDDNARGWVRSDLVGTRNMSIFLRAVGFIDSLKVNSATELFFDTNLQHKRIYISFPEQLYQYAAQVKDATDNLVRQYQRTVYAGNLTVRVLKPNSEDEYFTRDYPGAVNADPKMAILPFGRLKKFGQPTPREIHLTIINGESKSEKELLAAAKKISSAYPMPYNHVEIVFVAKDDRCQFWFIEDEAGIDYRVGKCSDK
jgi:hypothetical protein